MTKKAQASAEAQPEAQEIQFMIQRIYVKDISFEAPNTPQVFQQEWKPELALDLNTKHVELEKGIYEVILTVTATVKNQGTVAFIAEVSQAGIFTIQGEAETKIDYLVNCFCPNILFPYAREAITQEVIRGSFPQLVLSPINFEALYAQQMQQKQQADAKEEAVQH